MAEVELTFRGITFNDNTVLSTGIFMLQNLPEGLRHPSIRQTEQPRQNRHGVFDGISYYGSRLITLTGKIIAETQAERKVMEEELRAAFQLDGVQTGSDPSYYQLLMTDEDGELKQLDVKVSRGIEFSKEAQVPNIRDFIVELKAQRPVWLSQTLFSEMVDESVEGSQTMLPTLLPVILGSQTINAATITNDGNFATFPVITLTGEGENPVIENITTGETLSLTISIAAGDTVIIDCENGTVTKNGVDALSSLDTNSRFISLATGDNTIHLSDDTPASLLLDAEFEFRNAWI